MTGFDTEWRRSSFCETSGCVNVKILPGERGGVLIRTSQNVTISASREEWVAFVAGVKAGEFDWPERMAAVD